MSYAIYYLPAVAQDVFPDAIYNNFFYFQIMLSFVQLSISFVFFL